MKRGHPIGWFNWVKAHRDGESCGYALLGGIGTERVLCLGHADGEVRVALRFVNLLNGKKESV